MVEYSHLFKFTTHDNMTHPDFILYQRVLGWTTKKVVSGPRVSWFEVTQTVQQKRRCHAKGGGYCHQLPNHMGQAAPGSKGGTTDDNMSQCHPPTSERLGPDTRAILL